MKNTNCVQCGAEMEVRAVLTDFGDFAIYLPFCAKPGCPNFSLLATGELPEEKDI